MISTSSPHTPPIPDDLTAHQIYLAWQFLRWQPEVAEATPSDYLDAAYAYAKEQPETDPLPAMLYRPIPE